MESLILIASNLFDCPVVPSTSIFDISLPSNILDMCTVVYTWCLSDYCHLTCCTLSIACYYCNICSSCSYSVTFPFPSTFAMFSSSLFHVNVLSSVASLGLIVAFKVSLVAFDKVIFDLFNEIDSILLVTFTSQLASFPFCDLTVIVAVPPPTAVTLPVLSTVAIFGLLLVHFNVLSSVVSLGLIVCL